MEKPSEVIFPEIKQKPQYLVRTCPDCSNTRFKIIATLKEPKSGEPGKYRVKCTICDFVEVAITKNPILPERENIRQER